MIPFLDSNLYPASAEPLTYMEAFVLEFLLIVLRGYRVDHLHMPVYHEFDRLP